MRGRSVPDLPAPAGRWAGWAELVPQCCWLQQSLWLPGSSAERGQRSAGLRAASWDGRGAAYLHWDVMVHGSGEADGTAVVGERADHVEVAGNWAHEVQPQVAQGNQGVAQQTQTLADLNQSPLVVLSLLQEKHNKQAANINAAAAAAILTSAENVCFTKI